MNEVEHLLVCLMEECAEIQQAASKILRFGFDSYYPGTDINNAMQLDIELDDLYAVVQLIEEHRQINRSKDRIDKKKDKVRKHMTYSRKLGILE